MKVYLASRYSRYPEMQGYREELAAIGITVTSRWINGDHEWVGVPDEDMPLEVGAHFATEDVEDIDISDLVVNFTEAPRTTNGRGGRHWECGYAYAQGIDQVVVGHREHVFHCLTDIIFVETWEEAKEYIAGYKYMLDMTHARDMLDAGVFV
jgi:nucleoside 2-deoxyribosyltransferase